MAVLLVDIGNSRVKWAVGDGPLLSVAGAAAGRGLTVAALAGRWRALARPERIGVACVGQPAALAVVLDTAGRLWPGVGVWQCRAQARALGVTNAYPRPETLGVDRWLALLAAHRHYPGDVCVADCGTAITVDLLAADGCHRGGFIAPGLALMRQALAANTQALPQVEGAFAPRPAACTEAAIHGGVVYAALGLIGRVMADHAGACRLLLTGGDARLLAAHLPPATLVDEALVLRGLALAVVDSA